MKTLEKPLVFFDLETTGTAPTEDRIVDIALIKLIPGGGEESFSSLVDPGVPIPAEVSEIHHITDEMVRGQPAFKDLAVKINEFIDDADLGGFGVSRFDIPMLAAEFRRAGMAFRVEGRRVVDSLTIFHKMEPRNLTAAYKLYCGKTLEDAHRAEADTRASLEVFLAQVEHYKELPEDVAGISAFCVQRNPHNVDANGKFVWRNGKASFNFGKFRTKPLEEVARIEPGYLHWLAGDARTTSEVSQICREALSGRFPVRAEK